jgi:hypothetical protein
MQRHDAVLALVEWRGDLKSLITALRQFPWDCEEPLVVVRAAHICRALEKYLCNEATASDIEAGAEAVGGREDVEYLAAEQDRISDALLRLSSPEINGHGSFQ